MFIFIYIKNIPLIKVIVDDFFILSIMFLLYI